MKNFMAVLSVNVIYFSIVRSGLLTQDFSNELKSFLHPFLLNAIRNIPVPKLYHGC